MKLNNSTVLRLTLVASLFTLASLATAACGGDDDGATADASPGTPDGGTPDATGPCEEAKTHSDFTWINQHIFTASCAFMGCHNDVPVPSGDGLNLSSSKAYAAIVGVPSTQIPAKKLIDGTSTDCANSYLYEKIVGENLKPGTVKMPKAQPALCQEKIDAVCRWIAAGAPND
jgi:hypothetical protein